MTMAFLTSFQINHSNEPRIDQLLLNWIVSAVLRVLVFNVLDARCREVCVTQVAYV